MLNYKELYEAYEKDSFYSLQLEVGDKCFQACIYCYMNALNTTVNILDDVLIFQIIEDASKLNIKTIEWLGGEPLLREGIFTFMEKAKDYGIKNNLWTGGLPFENKYVIRRAAQLCYNGLISVHISTIDENIYKKLHPQRTAKDINIIIDGIKELLCIGYPSEKILNSVTFTGLQSADDMIATMQYFYENFGILTSLNVYHTYLRPEQDYNDLIKFIPPTKEVAKVYKYYKKLYNQSELPMNCVNKQYCSATLAVLNNGFVTPCATIREEKDECNIRKHKLTKIVENNRDYLNFKFFKNIENLNDNCKKCKLNYECWGCRSRSFANKTGIYGNDPRCFRLKTDIV